MRVFSPRSPQPAVWWPGVSSPVSQSRLIISLMISRAWPGLFIIWGRPKYITMMRWRPGARPRLVWGRAWLRGGDQGLSSELGSVSVAAPETDITTHIACVRWPVTREWPLRHVRHVSACHGGPVCSPGSTRASGEWGFLTRLCSRITSRRVTGTRSWTCWGAPASRLTWTGSTCQGWRPCIRWGQCSGHVISLSKSEDSNWDAGLWSRQTNWSVTETGASQHITISDHRPHFQLLTNGLNFHGKIDDLLKPSSNKCESLQNFWLLFT